MQKLSVVANPATISTLPREPRGHPKVLDSNVNEAVQKYVPAVRSSGVVVNRKIVISATLCISCTLKPCLLKETTLSLTPHLLPYWNYRDELSVEDGIVLKSHRVVISSPMKGKVLTKLRAADQGKEKTKLRARAAVLWNGINVDIDTLVSSCTICQKYQDSQVKEPLLQEDIPPRAWHTIAADRFHLDNADYLIVADYYCRFSFVRKLQPN
eukprot:scpid94981/ scgid26290/ Uncharacterized protein K02A2.6